MVYFKRAEFWHRTGFSESQANSIVSMMGDAFGATVTTKADLAALELRVYRFMVVQTGVTVGLIFAALFILIGGFGTFHRESASDAVQGQTSWRGLVVAPEQRCATYDADDYQYPQSVEDRIVAELGGVYGPYTGQWFANKSETDIEHMVARSEAHDSGLCAADNGTRRRFATDLLNLTLASPSVNRNQKRDHDAAEWLPDRNRCWFADRVVAVRQKYGLTIDQREAAALDRVLSTCSSTELSMLADGTAPSAPPSARTTASPNGTTMGTAVSAARKRGRTGSPPCRVTTPPIHSCATAMETGWSVNEATVSTRRIRIGGADVFDRRVWVERLRRITIARSNINGRRRD